MLLDTTTRKLQVLLSSAITTNNCPVVVAYTDVTTTSLTPGAQVANTNGVTAVDICGAPAGSTQRKINSLTVQNADTVSTTVTIRYNDNGTTYIIYKVTLQINDTLGWTDRQGWYVTTAPSKGRLIRTVLLTSTSANHTTSGGCNYIYTRIQAGGGGGGSGVAGTTQPAVGGGGSAGGYAEKLFAVSPNTAYAYTCGAGGNGGALGGANTGSTGSNSTFVVGSTTVTTFGGLGGAAMAAGTTVLTVLGGASPAVSTNGDANSGGQPGGYGIRGSSTLACAGAGGSSLFGAGGNALNAQGAGNNASVGYGGGGGGGAQLTNASVAGGNGAAGCIVVDEYT